MMLANRVLRSTPTLRCLLLMGNANARAASSSTTSYKAEEAPAPKVKFTEEELRAKLTEQEYNVTQNKGANQLMTKMDYYSRLFFRYRKGLDWEIRGVQGRGRFQLCGV